MKSVLRGAGRALATIWVVLLATSAQGATIGGGSAILTTGYANQLEAWLGQGPLLLTNIFTRSAGDTSTQLHAAVDGQGPTFSVLALDNGNIIGGYNPLSWDSDAHYHITNAVADRTAFLFNLSTTTRYDQHAIYQTYNHLSYGPTFGGGHDLWVASNLISGYTNIGHSYGDPGQYGLAAYRNAFAGSYNGWAITGLEVFAISEGTVSAVPLPAALPLLAGGLGLIGLLGWRRNRA